MSKIYEGKNVAGKREVTVDGEPLPLRNHPDHDTVASFSWSDSSPGSRNLAYSMLANAMDGDTTGVVCDYLLTSVVAKFDSDRWRLTDKDIADVSNCVCAAGFEAQQPWEDVGAPLIRVSTIPMFPKIIQDPNYHLRDAKKDL
jgi:hypothetical protein